MTTQRAAWKKVELLDRQSDLINPDGSKFELQIDLVKALQDSLGPMNEIGLRTFIQDVLRDAGVNSLEDLGGYTITDILQGILE